MKEHHEDRLIEWLRESLRKRGNFLIGDDAALTSGTGRWVTTVDQQILNTHFIGSMSPQLVAQRLLAVSLSDLAAMGARGRYGFLALSCPPEYEVRRFFRGLLQSCDEYDISLAGGDISRSSTVAAALTLVGELPSKRKALLRSRARAGDSVWIGGTVGESALGRFLVRCGARLQGRSVKLPAKLELPPRLAASARLAVRRHLKPRAQLELGRWLVMQKRAAAIDVSDGLSLDLARLCRESKLGAEIDAAKLPLARHSKALADLLGESDLDLALSGGEDYVLLFALPSKVSPPVHFQCVRIGEFTRAPQILLRDRSGRRPLAAQGWDQFAR